jgi:hypothetical protein
MAAAGGDSHWTNMVTAPAVQTAALESAAAAAVVEVKLKAACVCNTTHQPT